MGFRYFWLEGDDAVSDDDFRGRGAKMEYLGMSLASGEQILDSGQR